MLVLLLPTCKTNFYHKNRSYLTPDFLVSFAMFYYSCHRHMLPTGVSQGTAVSFEDARQQKSTFLMTFFANQLVLRALCLWIIPYALKVENSLQVTNSGSNLFWRNFCLNNEHMKNFRVLIQRVFKIRPTQNWMLCLFFCSCEIQMFNFKVFKGQYLTNMSELKIENGYSR